MTICNSPIPVERLTVTTVYIRQQCLGPRSRQRKILRNDYEEILIAHNKRMASNPRIMQGRSSAVEHPFGTLKRRAGWYHFLVRGLEKLRGEWSLIALVYNFTRVLNIVGIDQFIAYCAQQAKRSDCSKEGNTLILNMIYSVSKFISNFNFQKETRV